MDTGNGETPPEGGPKKAEIDVRKLETDVGDVIAEATTSEDLTEKLATYLYENALKQIGQAEEFKKAFISVVHHILMVTCLEYQRFLTGAEALIFVYKCADRAHNMVFESLARIQAEQEKLKEQIREGLVGEDEA